MNEHEATKRFYEHVWPHLRTVLRVSRFLSGADAEDLAQETMLKAFRGIGGFIEGTDVKAWLLTILRRTRIDRLRAAARSAGDVSLDGTGYDPPDPDGPAAYDREGVWENPEQVLNAFADGQVLDALQKLPEEIRLTLLLVDVEGLDQRDAATILNVPVGTVKSRTHRGRAMLRDTLLPLARDLRIARD